MLAHDCRWKKRYQIQNHNNKNKNAECEILSRLAHYVYIKGVFSLHFFELIRGVSSSSWSISVFKEHKVVNFAQYKNIHYTDGSLVLNFTYSQVKKSHRYTKCRRSRIYSGFNCIKLNHITYTSRQDTPVNTAVKSGGLIIHMLQW